METILVTGATGYIGSHMCLELINSGYNVIGIDNLSRSEFDNWRGIQKLLGSKKPKLHVVDLKYDNEEICEAVRKADHVIHLASYKLVDESCKYPIMYYDNNITGTINLLKAMKKENVKSIIYSSSATVYSKGKDRTEDMPYGIQKSPYALSTQICEQLLNSLDDSWNVTILRYFNAIGIHESKELTMGDSENIMPIIERVAKGKQAVLNIYGNTFKTYDGTCIRDYIHVMDIVKAHVLCLKTQKGKRTYNVGSSESTSVQDFVVAVETSLGRKLEKNICEPRKGDVPELTANIDKIKKELGWRPQYSLQEACDSVFKNTNKRTPNIANKRKRRTNSMNINLATSSKF